MNRKRQMSLRTKIALVLFAAVSIFAAADQLLTEWSFGERHSVMDEQLARENMLEVLDGIEQQFGDLDEICAELSLRERELALEPHGRLVDLLVIYDSDGWVELHRILDPSSGAPLKLREVPNERLTGRSPLVYEWTQGESPRGLLMTQRGALLVSSGKLAPKGDSERYIVVGRFLDKEMIAELQGARDLGLQTLLVQGRLLSDEEEAILADSQLSSTPRVRSVGSEMIEVSYVLYDLQSTAALILKIDSPRQVAMLWSHMSQSALISLLGLVILFPFCLLILLQWIVTGPLDRLSSHALEIGQSNDFGRRLNLDRTDEIGRLGSEFDNMLDKLEETRREVVRNAHMAGMSEISVGIIHNAKNILNSVRISSELLRAQVAKFTSDDLHLIVADLEAHADNLGEYFSAGHRGANLSRYLTAIISESDAKTSRAGAELAALNTGLDQMINLVSSMDGYEAKLSVLEELDLAGQLDAAMEVCLSSLDQEGLVQIEREYEPLPPAMIDRHRLMQVLVAILLNALHSVIEKGAPEKQITLRVSRDTDSILIEIADNGVGVEPEDLRKLFEIGYTTRKDGGGFGLHLAATTAIEFHGNVEARSDGVGHGATFVVRLPISILATSSSSAAA